MMTTIQHKLIIILLFLMLTELLSAQGAIDGYMKAKGETDIALTYSNEQYSTYFFGKEKRDIENTTQTVSLFAVHGISDSLNLIVSIPYIWTDSANRNFQDGIVAFKYRNLKKNYEKGALSLISAVGANFPIANYKTDTGNPIGAKATTIQLRFLAQYDFYAGYFLHFQTGYDVRVAPEFLSALPISIKAGIAKRKVYADLWLDFINTFNTQADNSLGAGNGTSFLKIGGTFYYALSPQFGMFLGGAHLFTGRNIGKSTRLNVGAVYKFIP